MSDIALEVCDLHTHFFLRRGVVKAVDGVSFFLRRGEVLGLVGESGCGKSLTALSVMRLLPKGGARTIKGQVMLDGENILQRSPAGAAAPAWHTVQRGVSTSRWMDENVGVSPPPLLPPPSPMGRPLLSSPSPLPPPQAASSAADAAAAAAHQVRRFMKSSVVVKSAVSAADGPVRLHAARQVDQRPCSRP